MLTFHFDLSLKLQGEVHMKFQERCKNSQGRCKTISGEALTSPKIPAMESGFTMRRTYSDIDTSDKRNGMLCPSEQLLMGRILDTKSSYKGDNAPQNILKINYPRLDKSAFATQHLLHHSIIYTFIYYHNMNENGYISELIPTEQVTFFLLVTNF
jgi:hypothetical protein